MAIASICFSMLVVFIPAPTLLLPLRTGVTEPPCLALSHAFERRIETFYAIRKIAMWIRLILVALHKVP